MAARGSLDVDFDGATGGLQIYDLLRWFDGQSLRSAAESFGLRKLDWDTRNVTKESLKHEAFRRYARNDAFIQLQAFNYLRAELQARGADMLSSRTAAGAASRIFRARYLRQSIKSPTAEIRALALAGCWGGRAEAFSRGSFPTAYEYDLKSAYPNAVVSLRKMPRPQDWRKGEAADLETTTALGGYGEAFFRFPESEQYPCLPVGTETRLLFPLTGLTTCTLAELRLAKSLGAEIKLRKCWVYDDGDISAAEFMASMLKEREAATGAKKVALKLLANSWTGKLAQMKPRLDLARLRKISDKSKIPMDELLCLRDEELICVVCAIEDIDTAAEAAQMIRPKHQLGSLWYPEWYGLITGYVRAQISDFARKHNAIYVGTDACWILDEISPCPMGYDLKRSGLAKVVRSRVGSISSVVDGKRKSHIAAHGIGTYAAADELLQRFDGSGEVEIKYDRRRPLKPIETLRGRGELGKWITEKGRKAITFWDNKRRLIAGGRSVPWKSVDEYESTIRI